MDKKAFILYQDYRKHLDLIKNPEDFRLLIEAIFDFADGKEVDTAALSPHAAMAFSFISSNISRDLKKYEKIKNARIMAGSKGGLAKVSNSNKPTRSIAQEYISDEDFANLWGFVPERDGTNNKRTAKRCIIARLKEGHDLLELESGLNAYRGYCARAGRTGTEMVMTMARFFGRDKYFLKENEWEKKGYERKQQTDNNRGRKYSPADMQEHLEKKARDGNA